MLRKISYRVLLMIGVAGFASDALAQENAFQRGFQAFQQKDYVTAVAALKSGPLPPKHALKDYERWALGVAMIETNDPKSAIPVLESLTRDDPDSIWANAARVQSGRAWLAAGDAKKAVEILQTAAKDPNPDWQGEALYYLGESETSLGDKNAAVAHWREAYLKDPGSSVEEDLTARLQSSGAANFTTEERVDRALKLFDAKRCTKALETLQPVLQQAGGPSLARVIKGECLYQSKSYGDATIYLPAASSGVPADRARLALLHLGISQLRSQNETQALLTLDKVQQQFPGTVEGEEALYRIGMIHLEASRQDEAAKAMRRLADNYASGSWRDKGTWSMAWAAFRKQDWPGAAEWLKTMEKGASDPPTQGKAIYWLGKVAEKQGDSAQAKAEWQRAVKLSPFSYYGVMALKKVTGQEALDQTPAMPAEWKAQVAPASKAKAKPETAVKAHGLEHFQKMLALYHLNFGKESLAELDVAAKEVKAAPGEQMPLLEAAQRSDASYASILLSQKYWEIFKSHFANPQAAEDYRANLLYPNAFRPEIDRAAQEFNLPPELILALMRQESGFMPWVSSSANAQGLMQLLPSTAAPRAAALGLSGSSLFDPAVNIRLGSSELSAMLQRFNNNWPQAFAAYNAGPGRAKEWGEQFAGMPIDEWIEMIPFAETNLYAKLVLRNYWSYKLLH